MPRVFTETGKVDIPDDQFGQDLAQGQWRDVAGKVQMFNRWGVPIEVEYNPEAVSQAINAGGRFKSSEEHRKEDIQEKYGAGFGDELAAFGLATLRGGTFGLSDKLIIGAGGERAREALAGFSEANPTATPIGEIGGAIVPIIASGGAGAAGKPAGMLKTIAGKMPTARLSRAAGALEQAMVKGMGKYGQAKGLPGIGARLLPKVTAGAVEGAPYMLGMTISEAALNDHELSAEEIISSTGMGMLLGGGIPFGAQLFKGAGKQFFKPFKKLASRFKPVTSELEEAAAKPGAYEGAAGTVTGTEPQILAEFKGSGRKAVANRKAVLEGDEMLGAEARTIADDFTKLEDDFDFVSEHSRQFKAGHVESQVKVGNEADTFRAALQNNAEARSTIGFMRKAGKQEYDQAYLRVMDDRLNDTDKMLDAYQKALAKGDILESMNANLFRRLDQDRQFVGGLTAKLIKSSKTGTAVEQAGRTLDEMFHRNLQQPLQDQSLWGRMGFTQADNNAAWTEYLSLLDSKVRRGFRPWTKATGREKFRLKYEGDPGKVGDHLKALGQDANILEEQHYAKLLDGMENVTKRHMKNYDMPLEAMAAGDRVIGRIQMVRNAVGRAREISGARMKFEQISKGKVGGVMGGLGGYVLGGPVGGAVGALAGAVMDPAGLIKTKAILDRFLRPGVKGGLVGTAAKKTGEAFKALGSRTRSMAIAGTATALSQDPVVQEIQARQGAADLSRSLAGPVVVGQAITAVDAQFRRQLSNKVGSLFGKKGKAEARGAAAYQQVRKKEKAANSLDNVARQSHQALWNAFRSLMDDPEELAARVAESIAGLDAGGPQAARIAQAVKDKAQMAVSHLMETAPRPLTPGGLDLMAGADKAPHVPRDQLIDWFERLHTVEDPLSTLDSVTTGMLLPAQSETLRAIYPRTHQEIIAEICRHSAEVEGDIPFRLEAQLSLLVGAPLSGMLQPDAIAMFQQMAAQGAEEAEAMQQPAKKLNKDFGKRLPSYRTAAESIEEVA